jgi:hypothetical protein
MAQRLQEKFSAEACVAFGKRHLRLNSQTRGAETLTSAIGPVIADLEVRIANVASAEAEKNSCYDLTVFMDTELDNKVKTTADRCIAYDRDHPGSQVYRLIFPDNTFAITSVHHLKETAEVKKIITRLETLPQDHPLRPEITVLQEVIGRVDGTIQNYYDAISKHASAKADCDIAKIKLIRQYTANMFDAEKMYGRTDANRLFPIISRSSKVEPEDETTVTDSATTAN